MSKIKIPFPRFLSFLPIKTRLFVTYLLLSSSILIITSITFYYTSRQVVVNHAIRSSEQQLSMITNSLKEKLENLSDYAITLSINSELSELLKNNKTVPDQELSKFFVNSGLTKQVQRIIGLHRNIDYWDILDTQNHWFHSSTRITDTLTPYITDPFMDMVKDSLAFQLYGPYNIQDEPYFVGIKPATDINTIQYLGSFVLLMKERNISSIFHELPYDNSSDFYIINNKHEILSSSDPASIYSDFCKYTKVNSTQFKDMNQSSSTLLTIQNEKYLLTQIPYSEMDWQIINLVPLRTLTMDHLQILKNILFIAVLLFILSLLFSYASTRTVTAPIQRLASKMESASEGNLDIVAESYTKDEISILYTQFNRLMRKVNHLLDSIYKEQESKRQMEVKLLQAQINPHFLYNTLSTIKSLVELNMGDTAIKAIAAMSSFYRNSLSRGKSIISLKQELELCEQYLYIQSLRFMEYVDYELINRTESALDLTEIPKLTIQPILENIFVHALSSRKCHICFTIDISDTDYIITIQDNGIGITQAKLTQLKNDMRKTESSSTSFGLPSIHHRLKLTYGSEYGLLISSIEGQFTTITLRIPQNIQLQTTHTE